MVMTYNQIQIPAPRQYVSEDARGSAGGSARRTAIFATQKQEIGHRNLGAAHKTGCGRGGAWIGSGGS